MASVQVRMKIRHSVTIICSTMTALWQSCKYIRNIIGSNSTIGIHYSLLTRKQNVRVSQTLSYSRMFKPAITSLDLTLKHIDDLLNRKLNLPRNDVDKLLASVDEAVDLDSDQCLATIKCFGEVLFDELPEVRTELVQTFWRKFQSLKVPLNISHYNALLTVYVENETSFLPEDILREIEANGLTPNRDTYYSIVRKYCQIGDMKNAVRIIQLMEILGMTINKDIFNTLILGYGKIGDYETANSLPELMKKLGIKPNRETYRNLLINNARAGDIDAIVSAMAKWQTEKKALSQQDILKIIYEISIHGHAAHVDALFGYLRLSNSSKSHTCKVIMQLTQRGQDEVAFKLLRMMPRSILPSGNFKNAGQFYLNQLVKLNRPLDDVIAFCKRMEDADINNQAYKIMLLSVTQYHSIDVQLEALRKIQSTGTQITMKLSTPLFVQAKSTEDTLRVLEAMINEFGLILTENFINKIVIQPLRCRKPHDMLAALCEAQVPIRISAGAVVLNCLHENDLGSAADIVIRYQLALVPDAIKELLISALVVTADVDSYVKFVEHIYHTQLDDCRDDTLGQIVCSTLTALTSDSCDELIVELLAKLVAQRLTISKAQEERVRLKLKSNVTEEMGEYLTQLSAGDSNSMQLDRSLTAMQLEELIAQSDEAETKKKYRTQLLMTYESRKDAANYEKNIFQMINEKSVIEKSLFANCLFMYSEANNLDKWWEIYKRAKEEYPHFKLHCDRIIASSVGLLCRNDRINDALQFLKDHRDESRSSGTSKGNARQYYFILLNRLVKWYFDTNHLLKIAESLLRNKYLNVHELSFLEQCHFFEPLIRSHLTQNTLADAVELFEKIAAEYKCLVLRDDLLHRIIQENDSEMLDRINKAVTSIRGERSSFRCYLYSLIDCGEAIRARKVIRNNAFKLRSTDLSKMSAKFLRNNRAASLELLLSLAEENDRLNTECVWLSLLSVYCEEVTSNSALDLWVRLQEAGRTPSNQFRQQLAAFLERLGEPVPFVYPTNSSMSTERERERSITISDDSQVEY